MGRQDDITQMLVELTGGNRTVLGKLWPAVYDELRRVARGHLHGERSDHTLNTTALVHEAYLNQGDGGSAGHLRGDGRPRLDAGASLAQSGTQGLKLGRSERFQRVGQSTTQIEFGQAHWQPIRLMNQKRWQQIWAVFKAVLDQDPDRREAFLDQACPDDADLHDQVRSLLQAHDETGLVDELAREFIAPLMAQGQAFAVREGQRVAQYQIEEKLGGGGMGVVYKAYDTRLKRTVALKFLPPHLGADPQAKERFEVEAQAAAGLEHPNICTIYEIGEMDDGRLFIVMPFYAGETLKRKIARGPLPVEEAVHYALQMAHGLAKAHAHGIVHRDVKPANVMVTSDGVVKIVDFGLAKLADVQLTKTGTTLGTVAYMSPEQTRGDVVDHRTDLWALGVVLYEMLVGARPFRGDYAEAIIYSILNEEPEPLTASRDGVPIALERVVREALAKNHDERYQHADEIIVDLKSLAGEDQLSRKQKRLAPTRSSNGKRVWRYGGWVVFLLLLVVAGLSWWKSKSGLEAQREERSVERASRPPLQRLAVLPFANLRSDPETDFLGYAVADQIIGSLAYFKNILVRPSSAVRSYQNRLVDATTAGADLKVDFVLTGNYLKEAEIMRLNVELVNVTTNEMVWRESIRVNYENAFALQDSVAERVADGLKIQFSQDERGRLEADVPRNPVAYEYYLRSTSYPNTNEGNALAIEMLEQSIERDSTYAPAFYELGYRSYRLASFRLGDYEEVEEARQAYEKALSLNPELLSALGALALLFTETGRIGESVELSRRALRINPNNSYTHYSLSHAYRYAGMLQESQREAEKALELDPENPRFRSIIATYTYLGQYDQAFEAGFLDEGSTFSTAWQGGALFRQGKRDSALAFFDRAIAMEPEGLLGLWATGIRGFVVGDIEEGLAATRQWEQRLQWDGEGWYHVANNYGLLGDKAGCLRALRNAIEGGFFNYPFMRTDSFLDLVRDDPEFQRLLTLAQEKHEAFRQRFFP